MLAADEKFVGLLLPPSAAGVVANIALPLAKRVTVNLNYTLPNDVLNECIRQCDIRHVLTSRRIMERMKLQLDAEVIYLEDFRDKISWGDKIAGFIQSKLPVGMLERRLGVVDVAGDELLTVLFTSGSETEPKGVMLTHDNLASQIDAIHQAVQLRSDDVAIGVMPFFHSYGYTATLWTVLALEPKGVYHYDPRDAHQIGKLCAEHGVSVFMATPTFLRIYLRRVEPQQFRTLNAVFGAAEKLPNELADAFRAKFGAQRTRPMAARSCRRWYQSMCPPTAIALPPRPRPKTAPSAGPFRA